MTNSRALIVEDDQSWQQIISEILTDAGVTVNIADNLGEAIDFMKGSAHTLAVVDLSLGSSPHNQDGLRVLDSLQQLEPKCKTIMLTGYATVELAVSAITEHGALTCLRKEIFKRTEFRRLVEQIIAGGPPVGQVVSLSDNRGYNLNTLGRYPLDSSHDIPDRLITTGNQETPRGTILVVEDDIGWLSILSELLEDAGYRVRSCSSFGESLGYLRRERYLLAIVDLSLTDTFDLKSSQWVGEGKETTFEGYRLLASARAGGIPTIVVSGVLAPHEIERTYQDQGIFAFVQKGAFNRRVFLRTVEEALATSQMNHELDILTEREREVLKLLAQGLTNKEIADGLVISTNTVKRHLKAIFNKLDVHTRSAAATKVSSSGSRSIP